MSTFTLAISFDHFQFALIHGPDIPGSYSILLFTASDLASVTSHIHKGNQFRVFTGRTDAEAETPILWPPDEKN